MPARKNTDNPYAVISQRLKLLAHPERLQILDALRREPECVCHLGVLLDKPQPYISQQLRILRVAGVIEDEKDGLNVYYRVIDREILTWLDVAVGAMEPNEPYKSQHQEVADCPCPKCADEARQVVPATFLPTKERDSV